MNHQDPPDEVDVEYAECTVKGGVFGGKSDVSREFVRGYVEDNENERIAAAVARYERERVTLGDAARRTDIDRWTMRDIFRECDSVGGRFQRLCTRILVSSLTIR